jgi:hypothetical protein
VLSSWQIRDGKWIHFGNASPVTSIGSALLGMRELLAEIRLTEPGKHTRGAA